MCVNIGLCVGLCVCVCIRACVGLYVSVCCLCASSSACVYDKGCVNVMPALHYSSVTFDHKRSQTNHLGWNCFHICFRYKSYLNMNPQKSTCVADVL